MDINRLTQKCQEALHDAQAEAVKRNHNEVDGEHLLFALCKQKDGLIPRLFEKMNRPADVIAAEIDRSLAKRPSVSGPR